MQSNQPMHTPPHEVQLQQQRVERESENRKLLKLKEKIRVMVPPNPGVSPAS